MGVPTVCKKYTMKVHAKSGAYMTVKQAQEAGVCAKMVIIDFTYAIKYIGKCTTGSEYFLQKLLPEFFVYFQRGCQQVMLVFDRFSPPNKYEEQERRYRKIVPHKTPTNARELLEILHSFKVDPLDDCNTGPEEGVHPEQLSVREFVAQKAGPGAISACSVQGLDMNREQTESEKNIDAKFRAISNQSYAEDVEPLDIPAYRSAVLEESARRIAGRIESGDLASLLAVTDLVIPEETSFKRCMANSQLKAEFMHYITLKITGAGNDHERGMAGIYKEVNQGTRKFNEQSRRIPFGATLCLHGVRTARPERNKRFASLQPPDSSLTLVYSAEENGRIVQLTKTADEYHPPDILTNIGEGEIGCMYYSLLNLGNDQLVVSVDGDILLLALLASARRFESDGKTFRNNVFVLLKNPSAISRKNSGRVTRPRTQPKPKDLLVGGDEKKIEEDLEGHLYINVNVLYRSICERGPFSECANPIATHVAVTALMGNDYIIGFAPGLASGSDTVHEIPWVFLPFVNQPRKFAEMVTTRMNEGVEAPWYVSPWCEAATAASRSQVTADECERNPRNRPQQPFGGKTRTALDVSPSEMDGSDRRSLLEKTAGQILLEKEIFDKFKLSSIKICLKTFRLYVYACYYYKYREHASVRKALERVNLSTSAETDPTDEDLEVCAQIIRKTLAGRKKTAMMSDEQILAVSRRLEWLLLYWSNSYVERCEMPNPSKTIEGKSYYGWTRSLENPHVCTRTDDVYRGPGFSFGQLNRPTMHKTPHDRFQDDHRRNREREEKKERGKGNEEKEPEKQREGQFESFQEPKCRNPEKIYQRPINTSEWIKVRHLNDSKKRKRAEWEREENSHPWPFKKPPAHFDIQPPVSHFGTRNRAGANLR